MKTVSLIVGGDLAPTQTNYSIFERGDLSTLIDGRLFSEITSADFRIFNLEVPFTDTLKPIIKDGPTLVAPSASVKGLASLAPAVFGLANNHILDQDEQGLINTMNLLSENRLQYVGAGKNISGAAMPLTIEKEGIRIGIYACAENEFSIAGESAAGANPFDPLESPDHIAELKANCDFVVVLHHGGKEHCLSA